MKIVRRKRVTVLARKSKEMYNDTVIIFKQGGNLHMTLEAMHKSLPYLELMRPLNFSVQPIDL